MTLPTPERWAALSTPLDELLELPAALRPARLAQWQARDPELARELAALLAAMKEIAQSRSRERMMKESMYSASKLRSRLSAKDEDVSFSVASESIERPAYLRRKPSQGKGDV